MRFSEGDRGGRSGPGGCGQPGALPLWWTHQPSDQARAGYALRASADRAARRSRAARPVAARPGVTDIPRQRRRLTWLDRGQAWSGCLSGTSRTRRRCAGSPCARGVWPGAAWTTPCPGSTACCPGQSGCTRSCPAGQRRDDGEPAVVAAPAPFGSRTSNAWGCVRRAKRALCARMVAERRGLHVVTGGTGAGKTTLLAALLGEVEKSGRILVVEDVLEMPLHAGHVIAPAGPPGECRGAGLVTLVDLVHKRWMRPDRLVVGEVRGAEVRELLLALNTGHEGGCCIAARHRPADARPVGSARRPAVCRPPPSASKSPPRSRPWCVARTPAGRMVTAVEELW